MNKDSTFASCQKNFRTAPWAPKTIFVNSMSDLFHKDIPDDYIQAVARGDGVGQLAHLSGSDETVGTNRRTSHTKLKDAAALPHIWWGVSVENKKHGLPRIDHLRQAPAAVRFLQHRAAAGRPRPDQPGRHLTGHRGRRERAGARPMARVGRFDQDQCDQQVPFFFKQWGGVHKAKNAAPRLRRLMNGRRNRHLHADHACTSEPTANAQSVNDNRSST